MRPTRSFLLSALCWFALCLSLGARAAEGDAPSAENAVSDGRFFFDVRAGYPLMGDIGGASYTGLAALGVGVGYKLFPFLAVVGATQGALSLSSGVASTAILTEAAYLAELMLIAGDTGLYGSLRGGFSLSTLSFTNTTFNGIGLGGAWGTRVGYTYRFADSRFSLGPEWGWMQLSSVTFTEGNSSVVTPSHEWITLQLVAKWVF